MDYYFKTNKNFSKQCPSHQLTFWFNSLFTWRFFLHQRILRAGGELTAAWVTGESVSTCCRDHRCSLCWWGCARVSLLCLVFHFCRRWQLLLWLLTLWDAARHGGQVNTGQAGLWRRPTGLERWLEHIDRIPAHRNEGLHIANGSYWFYFFVCILAEIT